MQTDTCAFTTISRCIILRMRKISDTNCRENQNTCFVFNDIFPKIVPFVRLMWGNVGKCGVMSGNVEYCGVMWGNVEYCGVMWSIVG